MFDTEEESGDFKQRLKKEPVSEEIIELAEEHVIEMSEAAEEVEIGLDTAIPGSYVSELLAYEQYIEAKLEIDETPLDFRDFVALNKSGA